jgi:hypothetical protein
MPFLQRPVFKSVIFLAVWMQVEMQPLERFWDGLVFDRESDLTSARPGTGYTSSMDSVRFGRALGFGARSAAKALAGAVDAATAANPSDGKSAAAKRPTQNETLASVNTSRAEPAAPAFSPAIQSAVRTTARATVQAGVRAQETKRGLARGGRRFGEAVWGPVAKLSGVLWLEMTGAFFGLFALFAGQAAWNHRMDLHPMPLNHDAHRNALVFCGMALVFGYFCVSSFVRAHRKGRKV